MPKETPFNPKDYDYPVYFRQKREKLKLPELDIETLTARAGSSDPHLAGEARRTLERKWSLAPEKDAENAETVDLMRGMERYSEEEQVAIVSECSTLQPTEGCNGNCYYCLYGRKEKGITAKFSFESIAAFIKKFGEHLPKNSIFYGDSDPMDYKDGEKNYTDIYRLWRNARPDAYHFVSTAIPRGGEDNFIDLMQYAVQEWQEKKREGKESELDIRISIAKHNIQRVEATFQKLIKTLLSDGHSKKDINNFFDEHLLVTPRFSGEDDIRPLGALIERGAKMGDVVTVACQDGVVIAPQTCFTEKGKEVTAAFSAQIVTAATIYEPAGHMMVELEPGKVLSQIPTLLRKPSYVGFDYEDSLTNHCENPILPAATCADTKELYHLEDPIEDAVLILGREVVTWATAIRDIAYLTTHPNAKRHSAANRHRYLKAVAKSYHESRSWSEKHLQESKKLYDDLDPATPEGEKLKFYVLLTEIHLMEMNFLTRQIAEGKTINMIAAMAAALRRVGRDQVNDLPEIFEELEKRGDSPWWKLVETLDRFLPRRTI